MILNHVKPGHVVTFMGYLASVVPLIVLPKNYIWNKMASLELNLLKFSELVLNELK